MAPRPAQIGLAVVSTIAAVAVAWRFVPRGEPREVFSLVHDAEQEAALFSRSTGSGSNVSGIGPFRLEPIDEETARQLFPFPPSRSAYDPDLIFRHRANLATRTPWPEHPAGEWTLRTNADGFREDGPARLAGADLGVLVAGDSHASGACDNEDTFAALLEERLAAGRPGERVEVLNAACPGYSFYNYLGTVRRFLPDRPDAVVVTVYGGNDFYGVLKVHHWLRGTTYPPRRKSYWDKVERARERSTSFLAQSLNQVLYFQEHPEQADVALEAALVLAGETRRLCAEAGARLVYVYVPPMFEVGLAELEDDVRDLREILDLEDADLFASREIGRTFLDGLERLGIDALDMGPVFRATEDPVYWARDLHINLLGHECVADELSRWFDAGGGEVTPAGAPLDGPYRRLGPGDVVLVEGAFSNGVRDGLWIERYAGGALRSRGAWRAGKRDGAWEWWYEDGTRKKVGSYRDEQPEGTWREWYRNGTLRSEGAWRAGVPEGEWREWHENGELASFGRYRAGREHGAWEIRHPDGALEARLVYREGLLDGPSEMWHDTGALASRGDYRGGVREGEWEFGREGGRPAARGSFAAGLRVGEWTFWLPGGEVDEARTGRYAEGERVE